MDTCPGGSRVFPDSLGQGRVMSGQRVGYTRVSSPDQNADRSARRCRADRVFTDSASGRSCDLQRYMARFSQRYMAGP